MKLHTLEHAEPVELVKVAELTGEQLAADAAALFELLTSKLPAGTVDHLAQLILQFDATREESAELQAAADFYAAKTLGESL